MHLTEAQISSFHEDGYLRLENVLDTATCSRLLTSIPRLLTSAHRSCTPRER